MRARVTAALRRPFLCARDIFPLTLALCLAGVAALQSCVESDARWVQPNAAPGEPEVRVRIARERPGAEFSSQSRIEISSLHGGRTITFAGPVTMRLGEGGWVATAPGQATQQFDRADALVLRPTGATPLLLDKAAYPGNLRLYTREDVSPGVFDVVEHVPIEMYVAGVVTKEMYPRWSASAYEAQAICARSYALHERQRRMAKGEASDLDSTDQDQVYGGASASDAAKAAAKATRGQILTWNGTVLRAYYSSTCAGRAASARDIWPTTKGFEFNLAAPIQGQERDHACQFSPLYRWTVTRDASDVVRRLAWWGSEQKHVIRSIKSVSKIEATKKNETGRPTEYKVTDANGKWWTVGAEQLRTALNSTDGKAIPAVTKESRISGSDFEATFSGGGGGGKSAKGAKITFAGRGFGHGVGMCQFCAEGFARRGEHAETMLKRFYPGAALRKEY